MIYNDSCQIDAETYQWISVLTVAATPDGFYANGLFQSKFQI